MKIEISEDKTTAMIDGVEYELKQKGKKISEWLQELPDGYRELALANFKDQGFGDDITLNLGDAVFEGFNFYDTKQGGEFWINVSKYLFGEANDLPPLPKPKFEEAHVIKSVCECSEPKYNYPEMVWCDNCGKEIPKKQTVL